MSSASLPSFSAIYKGVRLIDVPKLAFFAACALLIFGYGVVVGNYAIFPYMVLEHVQDSVEQVWSERDTLTGTKPEHFLRPARHAGDGVSVNDLSEGHDELVFLSGLFGDSNALRLIERDGAVVAEWKVAFSQLFPEPAHLPEPPATDWNTDTHGALMLPDGSVVFNFEYGGLVRLDRCGGLVWALPRATRHSVERAEGGGSWVPRTRFHLAEAESPFPPFEPPFQEDTLMKVSAGRRGSPRNLSCGDFLPQRSRGGADRDLTLFP